MNERIYELFEQALKEFKQEHEYATYIVPDPIKEKFAELIVQEIANTAVVSDGMFNGNERRLSVELRLGDMVKKISVFGVEE